MSAIRPTVVPQPGSHSLVAQLAQMNRRALNGRLLLSGPGTPHQPMRRPWNPRVTR